ncbi:MULTISPECIES: hypothetical protein [unclassified Microbacterium]|uniref:hypothetical protein n=1 Tax=unclassified Microbacterium TaxID=2609290 RepID=UPI00301801AF
MRNIKWYLVRRYLYGVALAVLGILTYHKVIPPEAAPVYLPLVLALFNTRPPAVPDETA